MTAAKHALCYLRGTTGQPIVYKRGKFRMVSYTDALFEADPDHRKSTTGYLFFLGGGLISFGSKTQSLTAQSTVESELQALSYGAREAVYFSNFLMELGFRTFFSVPINSDSTGALSVAGNAMFSSRIKHIALRLFFVRELIKRNKITLHHKPTQQMLADTATKHLSKQRFRELLQQIKYFTCGRRDRPWLNEGGGFFWFARANEKILPLSLDEGGTPAQTHTPNNEQEQHGPQHGKLRGRSIQQRKRKEKSVSLRV